MWCIRGRDLNLKVGVIMITYGEGNLVVKAENKRGLIWNQSRLIKCNT